MDTNRRTLCPSAQPDWEGAQVFGVVGGTADAPETAYLSAPQPVTEEILKLTGPVRPGEVFRMAAPCACAGCGHFEPENSTCRLAEKIVRWVPVVLEKLPACAIRPECRWYEQEGRAACLRCPQVVTENLKPTAEMRDAANPALT